MTDAAPILTKFAPLNRDGLSGSVFRNEFCSETMSSGGSRLCFTVEKGFTDLFLALSEVLSEPFFFLYVLIISRRSDHEEARYQSPELSRERLGSFLSCFRAFFEQDGRHNLWIYSPSAKATIVFDRHEIGYAYGPIELFKSVLIKKDLREVPAVQQYSSVPHEHNYHSEFDDDEASVIATFDWQKSPLREEDQPK